MLVLFFYLRKNPFQNGQLRRFLKNNSLRNSQSRRFLQNNSFSEIVKFRRFSNKKLTIFPPSQALSIIQEDFVQDDYDQLSEPAWHWCLLTIAGNQTIVRLRPADFGRYLRVNLASLTGSRFARVVLNSVSYAKEDVLVNVTLDWRPPGTPGVLERLAEANETILDLSGSHFRWGPECFLNGLAQTAELS